MTAFEPTVGVVGLGYIGLPTAAAFASSGAKVIGIDTNQAVVETIGRGEIHIVEPGLEDAVRTAVAAGRLRATTVPEPADAFFIAVPTPFKGAGREPDLSFIEAAAASIAPVLRPGTLVVLESTSPVGATAALAGWLAGHRSDLTFPQDAGEDSDIRIAYCPERVLPGQVLRELVINDRVIGGMTPRCAAEAVRYYRLFVTGECVIAQGGPRVAELTKLTENAFRDVNIAFANELSLICDRLDIDVWELIALANRHPRVKILQPGAGVGGHCIAVDPWFIVAGAPAEARLIAAARAVNDGKPRWVIEKVRAAVAECGLASDAVTIACYGLAFKPDIDDLRESPAVEIAEALAASHPGRVLAVEPNISVLPDRLAGSRIALVRQADAVAAADVHVLLVDHREFRTEPPARGAIVDTRGVWKT